MNNRTRTGLLARGFDTDLISKIERHGHTITSLGSLSRGALGQQYSEAEVAVILDKIVRKPIDEEVVEKVIEDSDGTCCFCADGNRSRPYQIHHAVEYSKTQDSSQDNLILICPNHHQSVPKTKTAEQQKAIRRAWHSIVTMANSYRKRGLSFPYGSFVSLDFKAPPRPQELIDGYRLSDSTALDVSRHQFANDANVRVTKQKSLIIGGGSGSGKTTLAIGVAGHLWERDFLVFRYRARHESSGTQLTTILTFIGASDRPCVLLIDDANSYLSETDLSSVVAAAHQNAFVIATWAHDGGANDERFERHFPDWVYVTWDVLRSATRAYLLAHDAEITVAIREREAPSNIERIGLSAMDTPLERFVQRYENTAKSAAEFFFLLRGGQEVVAQEIRLLRQAGRADVPVLYAALEQIAGFERTVSVAEVVAACNAVAPVETAPLASENWISQVFRDQVQRGKMQEVRGEFKPIHRDWAMRLINTALADEQASVQVKQFLERDLSITAPQVSRFIRLWTWFWYERNAGPYVRNWLAERPPEEWVQFISHAAADGLETLSIVADRAHLLFRHPQWDLTLLSAFSASEQQISALVRAATGNDWWALSRLSMAIEHVSPDLMKRIFSQWPPERVAGVVHTTPPDQYDWVSWALVGMQRGDPDWVRQVGKLIRWAEMAPQLRKVAPGDLESIFRCKEVLNRLHTPILRSTIRDMAQAIGECLRASHLSDLHVGFPPIIDITWWVYANDVKVALENVESSRLAAEMSMSNPRDWRKLSDLSIWDIPPVEDLITRIVDQIDIDSLAPRIRSLSQGCEHELRLLLHLFGNGSAQTRTAFASQLYSVVKEAASRVESERLPMTAAFAGIARSAGERLAHELGIDAATLEAALKPATKYEDSVSSFEIEALRLRELVADLESSGEDYVIDERLEQIR